MSRCLDCTECRDQSIIIKDSAACRAAVFNTILPQDHPFLSVDRKCIYFEEEGVDGNTSGDKRSDK